MILVLSLIFAFALAWPQSSPLRKKPGMCYLAACAAAIFTIAAVWSGWTARVGTTAEYILRVLTQGGLAGAMFILVMFVGAAKNKGMYRKKLMPIRAELSILASILTLGHNIAFGRKYFVLLLTNAADLKPQVLAAAVCSMIMILILLPLFITSFKTVRRRMKPRKWKRLQRMAYGFYFLMPVHVLLLNAAASQEGKTEAVVNVVLYTGIFTSYAVMRIRKALVSKFTFASRAAAAAGAAVFAGVLFLLAPRTHETVISAEAVATSQTARIYTDGKYSGSALGYNGKLKVSVVIEGGCIADIMLESSVDDEPYLSKAVDSIFSAAAENGSAQVDSVSGATTTSNALKEAINNALEKAKPQE